MTNNLLAKHGQVLEKEPYSLVDEPEASLFQVLDLFEFCEFGDEDGASGRLELLCFFLVAAVIELVVFLGIIIAVDHSDTVFQEIVDNCLEFLIPSLFLEFLFEA